MRKLLLLLCSVCLLSILSCCQAVVDNIADQAELESRYENLTGVGHLREVADTISKAVVELEIQQERLGEFLNSEDTWMRNGLIAGMNNLKKWNYPNIPEGYEYWTKEQLEQYITKEDENIKQWTSSMSQENRKRFTEEENEALANAVPEIFDIVKKARASIDTMQEGIDNFYPSLSQFFLDIYRLVPDLSKARK